MSASPFRLRACAPMSPSSSTPCSYMLPSGEKKTIDGFEYENKTSLDVRVSQVYIASHHSYFSYEVDKDETLSMKTIVPLPRESVARIILVPYKTRCRVEFE